MGGRVPGIPTPVRLAIGESLYAVWHALHPYSEASYKKDVIRIEVYTDQGVFKFDPKWIFHEYE
jgi:hypothetical protein